jgi:hypothetical protein
MLTATYKIAGFLDVVELSRRKNLYSGCFGRQWIGYTN